MTGRRASESTVREKHDAAVETAAAEGSEDNLV
jgi:hypothetical protein